MEHSWWMQKGITHEPLLHSHKGDLTQQSAKYDAQICKGQGVTDDGADCYTSHPQILSPQL